jgi:hypothetical protein
MANAVSNVKRVAVQGDVVLTLSPVEAIVLRAILGSTCSGYRNSPGAHATAVYNALGSAEVPAIQRFEDIVTNRIDFKLEAEELVLKTLNGWNPKT